MYSWFAQSGSWPCPWSASRRAALERRSFKGRVYPSPPCRENAVTRKHCNRRRGKGGRSRVPRPKFPAFRVFFTGLAVYILGLFTRRRFARTVRQNGRVRSPTGPSALLALNLRPHCKTGRLGDATLPVRPRCAASSAG